MRVKRIEMVKPKKNWMAAVLECTNCGKGFKAHGLPTADFIYREVLELRCPACGYQDQPASPCPHCDDVKPVLRVVAGTAPESAESSRG